MALECVQWVIFVAGKVKRNRSREVWMGDSLTYSEMDVGFGLFE